MVQLHETEAITFITLIILFLIKNIFKFTPTICETIEENPTKTNIKKILSFGKEVSVMIGQATIGARTFGFVFVDVVEAVKLWFKGDETQFLDN
ncbi:MULTISPECIES: hypothetical protein [unclassified Microcoleus]|uniref:hypothetical protein n=1 Tax=unclassified Microcoleus TaxID=2642155 RepID=UPI002FCF5894